MSLDLQRCPQCRYHHQHTAPICQVCTSGVTPAYVSDKDIEE